MWEGEVKDEGKKIYIKRKSLKGLKWNENNKRSSVGCDRGMTEFIKKRHEIHDKKKRHEEERGREASMASFNLSRSHKSIKKSYSLKDSLVAAAPT